MTHSCASSTLKTSILSLAHGCSFLINAALPVELHPCTVTFPGDVPCITSFLEKYPAAFTKNKSPLNPPPPFQPNSFSS